MHLQNVIQSYTRASRPVAFGAISERHRYYGETARRFTPLRRRPHQIARFAQVILAVIEQVKPLQRKPRTIRRLQWDLNPQLKPHWKQVKNVRASEFFVCFISCFITARITFTCMVMCILKGFWRLKMSTNIEDRLIVKGPLSSGRLCGRLFLF